jgi:mono/diheme cytochrome c family protein
MNLRMLASSIMISSLMLLGAGCRYGPAKPEAAVQRPDQVSSFGVLYQQNCVACHGANGKHGAAISLANPVYLALAGIDMIQKTTANGVPGTLMPAFAKNQGGMLTDQQVAILAQGMESTWGKPGVLQGHPSVRQHLWRRSKRGTNGVCHLLCQLSRGRWGRSEK